MDQRVKRVALGVRLARYPALPLPPPPPREVAAQQSSEQRREKSYDFVQHALRNPFVEGKAIIMAQPIKPTQRYNTKKPKTN